MRLSRRMIECNKVTESREEYFKWRVERSQEIIDLSKDFISLKNKKVLDVGCGEGALSYLLSKQASDVESVDINEKYLEFVKKKGIKNIRLTAVKDEHLPFKDDSFDAVFSFDVLEHMKNPGLSVSEIKRCLKKGDCLFIEFTPYYSLISGHHLYTYTILPAQFLPKKLVKWYVYRKNPNKRETPQSQWQQFESLNHMSIARARKILLKNGFKIEKEQFIIRYPNLFTGKLKKKILPFLLRIGFLKEILATNYQAACRKL